MGTRGSRGDVCVRRGPECEACDVKLMCTRAYACTVVALIYNSSSRSIHCGSICHSCARSRTVRTQCTHVKCAHPLLFRQAPLRKNGHIHPGANGHQIGSYTLTCSHNLTPRLLAPLAPLATCSSARMQRTSQHATNRAASHRTHCRLFCSPLSASRSKRSTRRGGSPSRACAAS